MKKYELDIWQSGVCKNLAVIRLYEDEVLCNIENCQNVRDYLRVERTAPIPEKLYKFLSLTRKIVEGVVSASDYLIEESSISLDPDKLWIDSRTGTILFLPEHSDNEFLYNLCEMLCKLGGEQIAARIAEKNMESAFSYKSLLRFLSTWELENR